MVRTQQSFLRSSRQTWLKDVTEAADQAFDFGSSNETDMDSDERLSHFIVEYDDPYESTEMNRYVLINPDAVIFYCRE